MNSSVRYCNSKQGRVSIVTATTEPTQEFSPTDRSAAPPLLRVSGEFNVNSAVKTAATQTKPAYAGSKDIDFSLVRLLPRRTQRVGGLGLYSREFDWLGLKLTPMSGNTPLPTRNPTPRRGRTSLKLTRHPDLGSGNAVGPPGGEPFALVYVGHQGHQGHQGGK